MTNIELGNIEGIARAIKEEKNHLADVKAEVVITC